MPQLSAPAPTQQEYIDAAAAVYSQKHVTCDQFLTPLVYNGQPVVKDDSVNGFYAEAYTDGFGNIIIAFEGTSAQSPRRPCRRYCPQARNNASGHSGRCCVYRTGPSRVLFHAYLSDRTLPPEGRSGGRCRKLRERYCRWRHLRRPGLPGYYNYAELNPDPNFVDYIEAGDPDGKYAYDVYSGLNNVALILGDGSHFGQVQIVGDSSSWEDDL